MQKTLCLLLSLLLIHIINAADDDRIKEIAPFISGNTEENNSMQVATLLTLIKKENETISPNDGIAKRWTRNTKILCNDPYYFCGTEHEDQDSLTNYIMDQKFTINGEGIFTALGMPAALQMKEEFEKDQKSKINECQPHRSKTIYSCKVASSLTCCLSAFPLHLLLISFMPTPANFIAGPVADGLCITCAICLALSSQQ